MMISITRAAQLRTYGQHGVGMARHINFRNNRNAFVLSICDELAHFLLRIVSAIGVGMPLVYVTPTAGLPVGPSVMRTPSRPLGQLGVLTDLHAPSAIVRQVQMEVVELVNRH